ncbi:MAG: DUF4142 domain-containing protein [Shinella sp.]|nr:DUF4142 domain-containing protein [Shinella sp.]
MKYIVIPAVMFMIATSAFAQSAAEKTGANSLLGIPPKTEDFVQEAGASDMFEVESSKLAVERADDATKAFARQMVMDHQKTTTEMKQMVEGGKVKATLPTAMTAAQQEMMDELKGLQGAEFTEQYQDDQVSAHETAVDLFRRYAEEGDNPELKAWAGKTLPALEHHLQMARDLNK